MTGREPSTIGSFSGELPVWQTGCDAELAQRTEQVLRRYEQMAPEDVVDDFFKNKHEDVAYVEALVALPEHNLLFGKAVYTAFAESASSVDRDEIVMYIPNLCRIDHDAGMALWDHLVRDPDPTIRRTAHDELTARLDPPSLDSVQQECNDKQLAEIGITWRDVAYLSRAYVEAEHWPHWYYQPSTPLAQDDQATDQ